jgi:tellurite resistance protein TerB
MALSDWWKKTVGDAKREWAKYNNATFKNAVMAACARMAAADGTIQDEEKAAVGQVISSIPELAPFDPAELFTLFCKYCDALTGPTGKFIGKATCDREIAKLKGNAGAVAAAIQITLAIANADGVFQPEERTVFTEVCGVLGADPKPYLP